MILLYVLLFILVAVIAMVLSYYIGLRAVGVKATLANAFKLAIVLLLFQGVAMFLSYLLGDNPVTIIVWLGWLIGAFMAWHKLLNRYYRVGIGKSLGAYIIAGIMATVFSVAAAIGAIGFVQSFKIDGNIMNPTLRNGDTVLAYKKGKKLEVNKVVIYRDKMNNKSGTAIGRILYTPGQTVSIKSNYVNVSGTIAELSDYTLKEGEYYIVGDNKESTIPRIINTEDIIGVVGPTILKAN